MVLRELAIGFINLNTAYGILTHLNDLSGVNQGLPATLILLGYVIPDAFLCGLVLLIARQVSP